MLDLYHWEPNGSALKPLIVVHEKRLDVRCHYRDVLAFEQSVLAPSLQTALNPEGEGPVLVHDGVQITESFFMMQYLEDVFPEAPLQPADAAGRWRMLAWARLVNEVFMPAVATLGCHKHLVPLLSARGITEVPATIETATLKSRRDDWAAAIHNAYPAALLEDSRRKIAFAVTRIEDALRDSPWLAGSAYSLADIDAFAIANCLPQLAPQIVNPVASPRTLEWIERIRQRPAVKTALATSRTGKPEEAFAPGPEHSRWG
jgi:glutathione S-transferase